MAVDEHAVATDAAIMKHFPKVELHRHLEGMFHVPTLHRVALKNELDVPTDPDAFARSVQFPEGSEPDFLKFLSLFRNDWYRSLDDVALIVEESVATAGRDGLVYLELRFSPEHFAAVNGFDRKRVIRTIVDAADAGAEASGMLVRHLITFNRSKQTAEEMLELYRLVMELGEDRIVGVDLAGDELNYPPELFRDFFSAVSADGVLAATIHAGEVTGPDQIWEAIESLGAQRIGHGVAALRDEELQKTLIEHGIALELCITSNYQTGSWADEPTHPFGTFLRAGVPVTLNSDDPTIQNSTLTDDYVKAAEYFNLSLFELEGVNERAIESSFLSAEEKDGLRAVYQQRLLEFTGSLQP